MPGTGPDATPPRAGSRAEFLDVYTELRGADSVGNLLSGAADLAPAVCGFTRALVASVRDHTLSATDSIPLRDPASDALRRLLLASPVGLDPDTEETAHVRAGRRPARRARHSGLADVLGLEHYVLSPVAPESQTLALLIVDRPAPPPTREDLAAVDAFAAIVGIALERLVLRRRITDLAQEVREFAGVAQALAGEALDAPPDLPGDHGVVTALQHPEISGPQESQDALRRLSPGERRIAALLVEGRTNREIAQVLVLSPETVKSHVAQILRKLGAANRVEATTLLLRTPRRSPP